MLSKIKTREELIAVCTEMRTAGRIVGYTSGVFDLIHPGHVDYLEQSRAKCDVLVVGVNSDASVRGNKGPTRPICAEQARLAVVAGLASVDFVFLFDENNNNKNIDLLKPNIYFKAGDYTREKLTSAAIVESHGGRVELIEMQPGYSSSAIIEKIVSASIGNCHASSKQEPPEPGPVVFLDRDGTICEQVDYLYEIEKFKLLPGVTDGLKRLQDAGFRLAIVTNQPGIGMGYFTQEQMFAVNLEMLKQLSRAGILIHKIYFCPHTQADRCICRKPSAFMIKRGEQELAADLQRSYMIGDMPSDIEAGKNAGVKTILLTSGPKSNVSNAERSKPDFLASDMQAAVDWILR